MCAQQHCIAVYCEVQAKPYSVQATQSLHTKSCCILHVTQNHPHPTTPEGEYKPTPHTAPHTNIFTLTSPCMPRPPRSHPLGSSFDLFSCNPGPSHQGPSHPGPSPGMLTTPNTISPGIRAHHAAGLFVGLDAGDESDPFACLANSCMQLQF